MTNYKTHLIYVRGRPHEVSREKISYREVVDLGYPNGKHGPLYEYAVTWEDGPKDDPEGILKEDDTIQVVDNMRFNVKFTDKS